ncbi:MAG: DUF2341 domain-containing protein [Bacteroidetes bacterium]|nr:DUF2341 domain-containing protein [Bacteroidota bacterium]
MNRFSRLRGLLVVAVLLCVSGIGLNAQCPGGLGPWLYRVPITISNAGGTLTNYFLLLKINTSTPIAASKMRADGGDLRFADANCNLMNFWVQNGMNSATTNIWVKVPSIPTGNSTMYIYYGNSSATRTNQATDVWGNGIICLFTFTEGSGGTLTDWVGGNNLNVTCSWTTGFRANVSALTGFNAGRAFLGANGPSLNTGSFTVVDYIYPTSANGSTMGIIGNYNNDGANGWVNKLQGGAGQFMLLDNQGGNWCQSSVGTLQNNQWQMNGVRRTAGNINNGLQNGAVTGSGFCGGDNRNVDGTGPFEIGHSYNNSYAFSGNISLAAIYNVSLSDGEVSALHNSIYANPEPTPNLGVEETVAPPVITQQPTSQALCQGGTVTFTVAATGQSLTYQWRKNSVPIVGATGTSYTIVNVQPSDAGIYDCVVRNQVTTSPATLTVYTPPGITQNPTSATVCPGTPVTFSVQASGSGLVYQWRKNSSNIVGANGPQYLLPSVSSSDNGSYDCVVSGTCGSPVTSNPATFTLRVPPTILSSTGDQHVCRGQMATFSVVATGEALVYQWRKDGINMDGANSPTLNVMAQPYNAGDYDCVITGACDPSVTTPKAHLTVDLDPIITEQPLDQSIQPGTTVTFHIKVIGGGIISYQWQKDGVNLPGRTHDTLIIQNATIDDIAEYSCVIRGTICSDREVVVSDKALLYLNVPPTIVKQPQDQSACEGSKVTLSVTAAGIGLSYQWRKNGVNIPGATSRDYTIDQTVPGDAASYDCVINAPGASQPLITSPAAVTINQPAFITTQPGDVTVCPGQKAVFKIGAGGSQLTYQWRKNGSDISGATLDSLTISAASVADTGSYSVFLGGACTDSVVSLNAHLILNESPKITDQPTVTADSFPRNGTIVLVVKATGTNVTYQWRKDGAAIPGATSSTYTITNAQPENSGNYDCVVSGLCDPAATSDKVKVVVGVSGVPNYDITTGASMTVVPQPASGMTRLTINLPQGVVARPGTQVVLYDAMGKPALNLSDLFERGGFHTVEFNAAVLPSGTYYCRVSNADWNATLGSIVIEK